MSHEYRHFDVGRSYADEGLKMSQIKLRVISLGAGVQSTTMALMAAHGEIGPMPDCAIFADTQSEPKAVYDHLRWLMSSNVLPFPVHIVSAGDLSKNIGRERPNGKYLRVDIPAFVKNENWSVGIINRSCTRDFKIDPIRKKIRQMLDIFGKKSPREPICEQWIGISQDESQRMKDAREPWTCNRWPLIENNMTRRDCLKWLDRHGYPKPPKSSCTFCPYHTAEQWRALTPIEFDEACAIDRRLRDRPAAAYRLKGTLYLHRSCVPLEQVDFSTADDRGQIEFGFLQECDGMCGV